jgi:RNA polymerase sigma-70 factor (sigma-E family)
LCAAGGIGWVEAVRVREEGFVLADEENEFTTYVAGRFDQLRRTAYLLCQDWHAADDVLQTTLTRLYLNWRRVRAADNSDAYVHTMLVRVFLAERRRGWVRRVALVAEPPDAAIEHDHTQRLTVEQALRRLPAGQRAALVLRFYCDLSVEQTAEILGCAPGTVKSKTTRALTSLRRVLGHPHTTEA